MPTAVFSPRIVGDHRADFHSLEAILASPTMKGKQGEALVLAIYQYFTSTRDGTWHFWPMNEQQGDLHSNGDVCDPLKILNAYGWTICAQSAEILQGLYRAAGFDSRICSVPGHVLCEVFYDQRWHVLDVDMWTWFRTPEGHLASVAELSRNAHALILDNRARSNPCNLPDRTLESYAAMHDKAAAAIFPLWSTRAHAMDFILRPGETLIRSETHAGRFHLPRSWQSDMQGKYKSEWQGIPRERFEPFRTIGNGRWLYAPDLSLQSRDFDAGVWNREGITQDDQGLLGAGVAIFRLQSPYPWCGMANEAHEGFPAADGVWVDVAGEGAITVAVTDLEGGFVDIIQTHGAFAIRQDITQIMTSRYQAMLRFTLAPGARLRRFAFEGYVMVAPASLPRLVAGANRMELRTGDRRAQCTTPWTVPVDFRTEQALKKHLIGLDRGTFAPGKRKRVCLIPRDSESLQAVFRIAAPDERVFTWAYAIVTVPEGPVELPPRQATLEWSADGIRWTQCAALAIPHTSLQWDASIDGDIVPPQPARALWLRVTSDTGIGACEFTGHLAHHQPLGRLQIIHRWREGQQQREFIVPQDANEYHVTCGSDPRDHAIEMRVPSVPV